MSRTGIPVLLRALRVALLGREVVTLHGQEAEDGALGEGQRADA
jgi:hypothetical protein